MWKDSERLDFLDAVSLISFLIGLQNLDLNITERDITRQTNELDERINERITAALMEIHDHLKRQDKKLDELLKKIQ